VGASHRNVTKRDQARGEGGETGTNSRAPSSHGGLELSAVLTHGGSLGFELQTKVHKNKFFFRVINWSWWALGFSQVRLMDITALPEL